VCSGKFLESDVTAVELTLQALGEADQWAKNNIQAVAAQLSPSIGLPASVLAVSLGRESYGVEPVSDDVIASQQRIADTFVALGLLPRQITVSDLRRNLRF
jgi:sulfonate transport system substrate-binding protein